MSSIQKHMSAIRKLFCLFFLHPGLKCATMLARFFQSHLLRESRKGTRYHGLSYQSTRGKEANVTASQAILKGLAADGGLFMPSFIPKLDKTMKELSTLTYQETAYEVMKLFLTDYTEEELKKLY